MLLIYIITLLKGCTDFCAIEGTHMKRVYLLSISSRPGVLGHIDIELYFNTEFKVAFTTHRTADQIKLYFIVKRE